MSFTQFLESIFGSKSQRDYKKYAPLVEEVKETRAPMKEWDDAKLQSMTETFRQRLQEGETVDDLMIEAYAVVWETCRRLAERKASWEVHGREVVWDMVPYDVQIWAAWCSTAGSSRRWPPGKERPWWRTFPSI